MAEECSGKDNIFAKNQPFVHLQSSESWLKISVPIAAGSLLILALLVMQVFPVRADAILVGYRDFNYGTTVNSKPTGEKPESKLWWNDGIWWGSLWNPSSNIYDIYKLDLATQTWVNSGTPIDDRSTTKADTLWDGQHLYVVSHIFTENGTATTSESTWGRLYRYSYDSNTKTYSLNPSFPTTVTKGKSETLVVDKDSTNTLWVIYVEDRKVMVNHSIGGDDLTWDDPYVLPFTGAANLKSDDISSLIAYQGHIGVMWSNQNTKTMYFAVHLDGDPDNVWQIASAYTGGNAADDHINLKSLQADPAGNVFAVTKTSFTSVGAPLIVLLACISGDCTSPSDWGAHTVYNYEDNHTRPILLIDTTNRELHVFTTNSGSGGAIHHKSASVDNIQFAAGQGDPFIQSSTDLNINNATSTKQNVNSDTGIVVLACDANTNYYFHNYLPISGGPVSSPTFTPSSTGTNTPTHTPTFTNTPTISPTFTHTPTHTPTATKMPTDTLTPSPTINSPTFTPTLTKESNLEKEIYLPLVMR